MSAHDNHDNQSATTEKIPGMVVGDGKRRRGWRLKTRVLTLVAACVVLIAIIAGGSAVLFRHHPSKPVVRQTNTKNSVPQFTPDQLAMSLAAQGNYAEAEQTLQSSLAQAKTVQDKLDTYFQLSAVALSAGDYKSATNYAQAALGLDPNVSSPYISLANIAQAQGNKQQAIQYINQAIAKLSKSDPDYRSKLRDYNTQLSQVEAQ